MVLVVQEGLECPRGRIYRRYQGRSVDCEEEGREEGGTYVRHAPPCMKTTRSRLPGDVGA
jgi:hypothetical protein